MNSSIQAERLAKAIEAITTETARLGGQFQLPTGRYPDPATKYTLILEAVGAALAGVPGGGPVLPSGEYEIEPVEGVLATVVEPDAPKGKRKGRG